MSLLAYFIEHNRYLNVVGIIVILGLAYLFSRDRSKINFKLIVNALLLQISIAFVVLKTGIGQRIIQTLSFYVGKLYQFADEGSGFIFGNLANAQAPWGFIFAVKILPVIIFFGALMALLFHWRIIQNVVLAISKVVRPLLGTSGAETLCAIANSFLGQTEAPLLVRSYLSTMTKSELFVVMVSGMATISGAILAVFIAMGVPGEHLLASSVMAIPVSIMMAKIIYPETEKEKDGDVTISLEPKSKNAFDAISQGTSDGLKLAVNIAAMLVSFLALLAMINYILGFSIYKMNHLISYFSISWRLPDLSLDSIFSYIFAPFAYLLGVPSGERLAVGQLLGTKIAINELVAYGEMVKMNLSDRTVTVVTYALCGFSNFSCIGIQIGGIGALVPEKRRWLTELGLLAVFASSLSNLFSAMIAALLL